MRRLTGSAVAPPFPAIRGGCPIRRLAAFALAIALALAAGLPARPGEPGDSIRSVIVAQLDAFRINDLDAAYAHASPMIQSIFRNPQVFGRMVETGYPMIWRPYHYEMLTLTVIPSGQVQTVLFQDRQGRFHEADYEMRLIGGEWRINGVRLRALPGVGS